MGGGMLRTIVQGVRSSLNSLRPATVVKDRTINEKKFLDAVPDAQERIDRGEIIPEYEYITDGKLGWEYRQILAGNPDPWCQRAVSALRANHTRPHVVYTTTDHRIVACVDCMEDQHYVNYIHVKVNEMGRCRDCGNCFVVLPHPEPEVFFQDPHH